MTKTEDLGYLHPIIRSVVETKRKLGLPIHLLRYPHLCEQFDLPLVAHVNFLLDSVIDLRKEQHKELKSKNLEYYGVPQLLLEVYKDDARRWKVWSVIRHKVSACPPEVLTYCEEVLREAGKSVPKRPPTSQVPSVVAA